MPKKIGFLSFGHWGGAPTSPVPDGPTAIRQMVQLAEAAERAGFDGAWVRVHHFANSLSAPFPLLSAMAARTTTLEVGTGVVDLRYENPLYMAEEAAITDAVSGGRLQLGISRGAPSAVSDGPEQFGYPLLPGETWSQVTRERADRFRAAIAGAGIAHAADGSGMAPISPLSPGLGERIWWGAGGTDSGIWAGQQGMNLLSSTLLLEDTGRPFHIAQADQIKAYRQAHADSGQATGGRSAVTRSAFPVVSNLDELYFGRREAGDSVGVLDGHRARSGPTYAGSLDELAELFSRDAAMTEADYLLFALPNQLGVQYNEEVMGNLAAVVRRLGWK